MLLCPTIVLAGVSFEECCHLKTLIFEPAEALLSEGILGLLGGLEIDHDIDQSRCRGRDQVLFDSEERAEGYHALLCFSECSRNRGL